jgi:hypothetical protein
MLEKKPEVKRTYGRPNIVNKGNYSQANKM